MNLEIKKITKNNFSKYGQLISTENIESHKINNNTTDSFYDLIDIKVFGDDKRIRANIFKTKSKAHLVIGSKIDNSVFKKLITLISIASTLLISDKYQLTQSPKLI